MAIREYQCNECGHIQEYISNDPTETPDECRCGHTGLTKLFSMVGGYKINGNNSASVRPKNAGAFRKALKVLVLSISLLGATAQAYAFSLGQYTVMRDIIWAADKAEVPRSLLLAVCWGEGSFRHGKALTHFDGHSLSHGTCQVKMDTAKFMDKLYSHKIKASPERLEITKINAFYAAKFLKYQLARYDDDWQLAIDAYNRGTAFSRHTKYVKKFIKNRKFIQEKLEQLFEQDGV